jgi:hypothetical protein
MVQMGPEGGTLPVAAGTRGCPDRDLGGQAVHRGADALAALVVGGSVQHAVDQRTLLGPGRASTGLNFDESGLQPCTPDLWRPGPKSGVKPDLALAGIRTTVG